MHEIIRYKQLILIITCWLLTIVTCFSQGFVIKYDRPNEAKHQKLFKTLKKNDQFFYGDGLNFLNKLYRIPNTVKILVADCGSKNSRYNFEERTIYICYETLHEKVNDYSKFPKNNEEYVQRVFKNSVFTFWHEIGHAMMHQLNLPIKTESLNEEDLADEFAVLSMIWRQDSKWTNSIITSSLHYKNKTIKRKNKGLGMANYEFHSPDLERYYNMNCLLFGMKSMSFSRLEKLLNAQPKRAAQCKAYAQQRNDYWAKLLKPYVKYKYFD
jgi:hypothetical protein